MSVAMLPGDPAYPPGMPGARTYTGILHCRWGHEWEDTITADLGTRIAAKEECPKCGAMFSNEPPEPCPEFDALLEAVGILGINMQTLRHHIAEFAEVASQKNLLHAVSACRFLAEDAVTCAARTALVMESLHQRAEGCDLRETPLPLDFAALHRQTEAPTAA